MLAEADARSALAPLVVERGREVLAEASRDFGGWIQGRADGVLRPNSVAELELTVRSAGQRGLKLTARGRGLSQSGQSVPRGGLSLDLRGLNSIHELDASKRRIWVEPGVTWRELLTRLAPAGLRPSVMPLNLDISIAGTLSAGGFGSTSFRHGVAAANVSRLEVVTGAGARVACDRTKSTSVFDAVLAGLGRVGVIAGAELELVPVRSRTQTCYLLYEDPEQLLLDMERLAARACIDHLEAFCSASMQGLALAPSGKREPFVHWLYGLHVSSEFEPPAEPLRIDELLDGIRPWRVLRAEEDDSRAFAARYDARFEMMRRTGGWAQPHPWFECMLPLATAAELIPNALALLPPFLGDGHRVLLVTGDRRPQAFAMPAGEPVVGFAVLPPGVPEALRGPTLAALQRVEALLLGAGGKRYLSGYLDQMDELKWRAHYGDRYEDLARSKATLDPSGVFESCLSQPR